MIMTEENANECDPDCASVTDETADSSTSSSSQTSQHNISLGMQDAIAATSSLNFRKLPLHTQLAMNSSVKNFSDFEAIRETPTEESNLKCMINDVESIKSEIEDADYTFKPLKRHSDHNSLEDVLIEECIDIEAKDETLDIIEQEHHSNNGNDSDDTEAEQATEAKETRPSLLDTFSMSMKRLSFVGSLMKTDSDEQTKTTTEQGEHLCEEKVARKLSIPPQTAFSLNVDESESSTPDRTNQNSTMLLDNNEAMTGPEHIHPTDPEPYYENSAEEDPNQQIIQETHLVRVNNTAMSQHHQNELIEDHFVCEDEIHSEDGHSSMHKNMRPKVFRNKIGNKISHVYRDIESGKRKRHVKTSFEIMKQNKGDNKLHEWNNFVKSDFIQSDERWKRYVCVSIVILMLMLTAFIIVLGKKSQNDMEKPALETPTTDIPMILHPTASPATTPLQPSAPTERIPQTNESVDGIKESIIFMLQQISNKSELVNKTSPQYKAMMWLIDDIRFNDHSFFKYQNDKKSLGQRFLMAVLFFATSGSIEGNENDSNDRHSTWLNSDEWLTGSSECLWHGLMCENDLITKVDLQSNFLDGFLPKEISHLSHLRELNVYDNKIRGESLDLILNLTNLRKISMNKNHLEGSISPNIKNLVNLEKLDLSENALTGQIPEGIGNIKGLVELDLSQNELTGLIPPELFELREMTTLVLSSNKIEGFVSNSINGMKSIVTLRLNDNAFYGNVPRVSGLPNLEELHLDGNAFTGRIPKNLFSSSLRLRKLFLGNNYLTGSIPFEFGNLKQLEILHLSDNSFSKSIPPSLGHIPVLKELYLGFNSLTGKIPASMKDQLTLERIHFNNNKLHGHIPSWLALLPNLESLHVNNNHLNGPLPSGDGIFPAINEMALENNDLTGSLNGSVCASRVFLLTADCSGENPMVECSCCTGCFP